MKRFFHWMLGLMLMFAMITPVFAAEIINKFDVDATLTTDRMLTVTERITYDFGTAERHGIYRIIPVVSGRNGMSYRLRLHVLGARMDGKSTGVRVTEQSSGLEVRVGDPDRTVTGQHFFEIEYQTDRAINFFDDHSELYWNVTGNDWKVPIVSPAFHLSGPGASRTDCFTGSYGSTEHSCQMDIKGTEVDGKARGLGPMEGFTVVIGFPNGAIHPLTWWERALQIVTDNPYVVIPVIVFCLMFAIWWKFGKEPKGRGTIIPQYEPPVGMTPALMVSLDEQWMPDRAVSATILDLARRGYVKIKFTTTQESFHLLKLKNADDALLEYEATLFNGLFETKSDVSLETLKDSYWKVVAEARKQAFQELRKRGLFGMNPAIVRGIWFGIAFVLVFPFILLLKDGNTFTAFLVGIIIMAFGYQMPRMTPRGAVVLEEVKGFEKFLSVTEKARLDFTDAPERTPEQFEKFLPAAVAFAVETKWADQFADIMMPQPSYFDGPSAAWNAVAIAHIASQFNSTAASSAFHAPSSAGGGGSGFSGGGSGGGGGGGGGGSW